MMAGKICEKSSSSSSSSPSPPSELECVKIVVASVVVSFWDFHEEDNPTITSEARASRRTDRQAAAWMNIQSTGIKHKGA